MTSYEGLFLDTGRVDEGAALLRTAASTVSEGMLANTSDVGGTEYNTVDAAMWFLHAVGRHVDRTGDLDLGVVLLPTVDDIVAHHLRGTRFGIRVDDDGLITNGADGLALTWMDARVGGHPITQRAGKPVEVNALWISGLDAATRMSARAGRASELLEPPLRRASTEPRLP
jgi:predicted glycogen debranching enzyme